MIDERAIAAAESPVPLVRCTSSGTVLWANASATRLLSVRVGQHLGGAVDDAGDRELLASFLAGITDPGSRRTIVESLPGGPVELLGTLGDDGALTIAAYGLAAFRQELEQVRTVGTDRFPGDEQAVRSGRTIEQLRRRAEVDSRTGLARDHVFERDLPIAVGEARAEGRPVSVLLVDLDRFHDYNARYLYEAGHQALRAVAAAMSGAVRDGDSCYRYGGEELAVILPDTDAATASLVGDRIRSAVASLAIPHAGLPGGVLTVSVGVSTSADGSTEPMWLVNGANVAVIEAKALGRDGTCRAEPTTLAPPVGSRV